MVNFSLSKTLFALQILFCFVFGESEFNETKKQAEDEMKKSALDPTNRIWDQTYLKHHPKLRQALKEFESGKRCAIFQKLNTQEVYHQGIVNSLAKNSFQCIRQPLSKHAADKRDVLTVSGKNNTTYF